MLAIEAQMTAYKKNILAWACIMGAEFLIGLAILFEITRFWSRSSLLFTMLGMFCIESLVQIAEYQ